MKRICIIGLGWLGEQLADYLVQSGHTVSGTTTQKVKKISNNSVLDAVYLAKIQDLESWDNAIFKKYEYYVLTIPPSSSSNYSEEMFALIETILSQNPKTKLIYTSSTSVYGNQERMVDEQSAVSPVSDSAKKIVKLENKSFSNFPDQFITIRLGGLCGRDRHPVFHLSRRKKLKNPHASVNLIHAEDVCSLIEKIINSETGKNIINLCSTDHPSRKDYYQWSAQRFNIPIPEFDESDKIKDKTVICNGIINLGFKLKYISPYDYPEFN